MHKKISIDIKLALRQLQNGELVAFPTETVYGLGADARNEMAIRKVFTAKGRPVDHPLIVHLANAQQMAEWAQGIPKAAFILAQHFWPGPLTMILHKQPAVSNLITGGQDTIALRVPNHPITLELLQRFGSGLVGPSANKYGFVSPTTAEHVATDLGDTVAAILDGGACTVGIESTIVNLLSDRVTIMRQGAITAAQLSQALQYDVAINTPDTNVRVSGSHASHYAPHTPAYVLPIEQLLQKALQFSAQHAKFSVISLQAKPAIMDANVLWQQVSANPAIYAHDLYSNLRMHDELHNAAILIEQVPNIDAWAAVADRLQRAGAKD